MALSKTIQDKRRFPDVNEDDIEGMLKPKFKKNTEKSTLTSKDILNNFLKEADIALDLENCTKDELNNVLKKLYFAARKSDGNLYKITSYRPMRFGIQRHISSVRNWDIISDKEFREAQCF